MINKTECLKYNFNPDKKIRYDLYWGNTPKDKFFTSIHSDEYMISMILKKRIPHNRVSRISIYRKDKEGVKRIYNEVRNPLNFLPNPKKEKEPKSKKEFITPYVRATPMPYIDWKRCKTDLHYCRRLVFKLFNFYE